MTKKSFKELKEDLLYWLCHMWNKEKEPLKKNFIKAKNEFYFSRSEIEHVIYRAYNLKNPSIFSSNDYSLCIRVLNEIFNNDSGGNKAKVLQRITRL